MVNFGLKTTDVTLTRMAIIVSIDYLVEIKRGWRNFVWRCRRAVSFSDKFQVNQVNIRQGKFWIVKRFAVLITFNSRPVIASPSGRYFRLCTPDRIFLLPHQRTSAVVPVEREATLESRVAQSALKRKRGRECSSSLRFSSFSRGIPAGKITEIGEDSSPRGSLRKRKRPAR